MKKIAFYSLLMFQRLLVKTIEVNVTLLARLDGCDWDKFADEDPDECHLYYLSLQKGSFKDR